MDWPEWSSQLPIKSISRCPLSSTISIFSDDHPLIVLPSRNAQSSPQHLDPAESTSTRANNNSSTTASKHLPGLGELNSSSSTSSRKNAASSSSSGSNDGSNHSNQRFINNENSTNFVPQNGDTDNETFDGHGTNKVNFKRQTSSSDSTHLNSHLLELQKEIKEEEDEIFADINSAINSHTNFQDQSTFLEPPSSLADASLSLDSTSSALANSTTCTTTNTTSNLFEPSNNTFHEALHQTDHHHRSHTQDIGLDLMSRANTSKNTTIRTPSIYHLMCQSDPPQQNHHHILYKRAATNSHYNLEIDARSAKLKDSTTGTSNSEGNTSSSSSTRSNSSGISDCFNSRDDVSATGNEDRTTNSKISAQSLEISKTSTYFSNNPHHPLASASVATALSLRPSLINSPSCGLNNSDGNSDDSSDFNTTNKEEDTDQHQSILLKFGMDVAHLTNQWWSENDGSSRESQDKYNTYGVDGDVVYDKDDNIVNNDNYDPNNYYEHHHQYGPNEMEDQMPNSYMDHQDSSTQNYPTNNLPKPCVFFLEGNCRRSDCKYSHDLSNITCKYWIEGFCFKGELCPFLHSYNMPSEGQDVILNEDGSEISATHTINPTFTIESEADFPSLPLDAPPVPAAEIANVKDIKDQILKANPAVVFKMAKKKRKRG